MCAKRPLCPRNDLPPALWSEGDRPLWTTHVSKVAEQTVTETVADAEPIEAHALNTQIQQKNKGPRNKDKIGSIDVNVGG